MIEKNWQGLIKPQQLTIEVDPANPRLATIVASPLERGFGLTLGNALRRVLLSSLRGAAVSAIRIEGVQHEFSTISGVLEDVTDIILNLKNLHLRGHSEQLKKIVLHTKGPGKITAADFEKIADVEILNPELHICTVESGAALNIELYVQQGVGYVTASQYHHNDMPTDVIPIDAIYSPVVKVSYRVENARVGQVTDYDKLIMNIETNGALSPDDALAMAARILQDQLQPFINFEEPTHTSSAVEEFELPFPPALLTKIADLELTVRSSNCIQSCNIIYLGDLVQKTESEMMGMPNFGRKSLNEMKAILSARGLSFGMKIIGWPPENIEELIRRLQERGGGKYFEAPMHKDLQK